MREAVQWIHKREQKQNMYCTIGNCLKSENSNITGITRVDIPAPPQGTNLHDIKPKTWNGL